MPYRHVLVHLKGFLGDAVMVTPLLEGLSAHAKLKVDVLTEPAVISLLEETFPSICFHSTRRLEKPAELMRQAREMRALQADLALVINRSFRSALMAFLARIPKRFGHATEGRGFLLTKSTPYDEARSEVESYLDVARLAGLELPPLHPHLRVSSELAGETLPRLRGATVGLQPGARHPWKELPMQVLVEASKALQAEGHTIALFGGPEEKHFGDALSAQLDPKPIDLIGAFPLKSTLAAVSHLRVLIGADTGLMHMAAAAGCPTVTAFGPTSFSKWGHHYDPHQVVVAPGDHMSGITPRALIDAAQRAMRP